MSSDVQSKPLKIFYNRSTQKAKILLTMSAISNAFATSTSDLLFTMNCIFVFRTCCGFTEKSELQASTSIMIYAKDIKSNSQISSKFQDLLYLSMNLYEKDQVCQNCEKFILRRRKFTQTPNVLPVTVIWSCRDMATSEILLRSLDLTLRLEDLEGEGFYWLKTIVSFTVNHYCCYIYFPTHKCWQLIDDTRMTKFSNITQVTNHILRTSGLPVILFYEQSTQGISLELGENVLEEFTCLNCTSF